MLDALGGVDLDHAANEWEGYGPARTEFTVLLLKELVQPRARDRGE